MNIPAGLQQLPSHPLHKEQLISSNSHTSCKLKFAGNQMNWKPDKNRSSNCSNIMPATSSMSSHCNDSSLNNNKLVWRFRLFQQYSKEEMIQSLLFVIIAKKNEINFMKSADNSWWQCYLSHHKSNKKSTSLPPLHPPRHM